MTRAEIDSALAALAGLAANPPAPRGDSYLIAALARVVVNQEQRLRVLEPCAAHPARGGNHRWWPDVPGAPLTCCYCHMAKEPPSAPPVAEHPAIALLREIEWSDHDSAGDCRCPVCWEGGPWTDVEGHKHEGTHAPHCKLAALIKEGAR